MAAGVLPGTYAVKHDAVIEVEVVTVVDEVWSVVVVIEVSVSVSVLVSATRVLVVVIYQELNADLRIVHFGMSIGTYSYCGFSSNISRACCQGTRL